MSATEFIERTCPVCSSAHSTPHLRKGDLRLARCLDCQMIFASPVPREFVTGAFYDHSGDYYLSEEKLAGDYSPVRFQRELNIFRKYCPSGSVLDVGCSTGAFLWNLPKGPYLTLGTDVAGPALDYAEKKGVPVQRGDFLEQNFNEPFDAVTFWAVLEHLADPASFLKKAQAILKPGGYCFVLVPNFRSLATRILGARYRYILPQHVNYFTAQTLRALCTKYFTIERITSSHFNPIVIAQDLRGRNVKDSQRAGLLKRTTAMKQSRGLAPVRAAYRMSEFALSRLMLADNLVAILRKP